MICGLAVDVSVSRSLFHSPRPAESGADEFTPDEFTPDEFTPDEFTPDEFTPDEFTRFSPTPDEFPRAHRKNG